jgi:3-hydroxyacyl-CoA dehydrogenase/3-hydroxy-2-methylbutyryl-CoA dehydrogenase
VDIQNKVAVISGGASGLGEACIRDFAKKGAKVGILDLNEERGQALAAELGENAIFCKTDVSSEEAVKASVQTVVDKFGGVHICVNCAGVPFAAKVLSKKGTFPAALFNKTLQVNLVGTMNMICACVEQMNSNEPDEEGEKGVIVNCASGAAWYGQIGQAAYSASKAGVVGMTLPIAREIGDYGMRIVTIAPGLFETPMVAGLPQEIKDGIAAIIPFPKRLGKPEEFALLARQIVENPYINGESIFISGGVRPLAK